MRAQSGVISHHVGKQASTAFCVMEGSMHASNMKISLTLSHLPKPLAKVDMKIEAKSGGGRKEGRLH